MFRSKSRAHYGDPYHTHPPNTSTSSVGYVGCMYVVYKYLVCILFLSIHTNTIHTLSQIFKLNTFLLALYLLLNK